MRNAEALLPYVCNPLRRKSFYGVWAGNTRTCLLKLSIGKAGLFYRAVTPQRSHTPRLKRPCQVASPAAVGALLAALLALAAIPAVATHHRSGPLLVWVFTIEGSLDLVVAISLATVSGASASMEPAYWLPAFWVPAL